MSARPPSSLASVAVMASTTAHKQFLTQLELVQLHETFVKWLSDNQIRTCEDFGVMAAEEKDVTPEIIAVAAADGVKFERPMDKIAVRKLWIACRRVMQGVGTPKSLTDESVIPEDVDLDMGSAWGKLHGFQLPDSMLLIKTLQCRIWRGVAAVPPQVDVYLAETLRPMSCMDKSLQQSLALVPGKAPEVVSAAVDVVTKPIELWMRVRAFFMTLAYVSIKTPEFFDYQSAIFISEKVLGWVTNTFQGRPAPASFYVSAWAATVHHFSEQVRVTKQTMTNIVGNVGAYENRWLNYQHPIDHHASASSSSSTSSASPNVDLPQRVQEELARLRESTKRFQAERDSARSALRNNQTEGKGKGGGGKKGKGKGDKRRRTGM